MLDSLAPQSRCRGFPRAVVIAIDLAENRSSSRRRAGIGDAGALALAVGGAGSGARRARVRRGPEQNAAALVDLVADGQRALGGKQLRSVAARIGDADRAQGVAADALGIDRRRGPDAKAAIRITVGSTPSLGQRYLLAGLDRPRDRNRSWRPRKQRRRLRWTWSWSRARRRRGGVAGVGTELQASGRRECHQRHETTPDDETAHPDTDCSASHVRSSFR